MSKRKKKSKVNFHHAICMLSTSPVRRKADDRSEIVSQMLFGELCKIVTRKNKSWMKIECEWDAYLGWVDPKQFKLLSDVEYAEIVQSQAYSLDLTQSITNGDDAYPIVLASTLPRFDGMSCKIDDKKYLFNGQAVDPRQVEISPELLVKVAKKYLHAPYLWGGRSPFGIDCSGLTQCIFKVFGSRLPRDASDQAEHGYMVDFVEMSQVGDLAFFINKEGHIHHVGIILENNEILHASGRVRIDKIDHYGIYHHGRRSYTHQLRFVKRLI